MLKKIAVMLVTLTALLGAGCGHLKSHMTGKKLTIAVIRSTRALVRPVSGE